MHEQTHDTADDHGKQDTRRASIVYAYVHVHLQKKTNKIWGQDGRGGGVVKMFMPPVVRCGYFLEISPNDYLVTRISLTLSSNDFPHSSYSFWSRMVFGCW